MSKMRDADMPLVERIGAAIERIAHGQAAMRVPVEATDPDVVLGDCQREIDRLTTERDDLLTKLDMESGSADMIARERDELRDVLLRGGFVPCGIPACNCGSWHHRYGLPERMREIEFALADAGHERSNDNGHSILRALNALIARLDAAEAENERLRKFAGKVLNKSCEESIDVSCGDIEDWATQCGLLEQVTMTADCGDDCKCAEWTDFPLECLFPTALGSAAIDAAMGLTRPAEEA